MRFKYIFISALILIAGFACDNNLNTVTKLFPGSGFEKGWSWYGMPEAAEISVLKNYLGDGVRFLENERVSGVYELVYFWDNPADTSVSVTITELESESYAASLYKKLIQNLMLGSPADSSLVFSRQKYLIAFRPNIRTEATERAINFIADGITKKIDKVLNYTQDKRPPEK